MSASLQECVMAAFANDELMTQYRRLTGTDFGLSKGVNFDIDLATGHFESQALHFIGFVADTIWSRLPPVPV